VASQRAAAAEDAGYGALAEITGDIVSRFQLAFSFSFIFAISNATKVSLCTLMVRPPGTRLGSARPSNLRFCFARKRGPPASAQGHKV
jgi:hypothetical protein